MKMSTLLLRLALAAPAACMSLASAAAPAAPALASAAAPLSIGDTWTIRSVALGETRRINVYVPAGIPAGTPLPVLYMPDGGMLEDFLHVAGLLQVGAGNGTVRPFLLVGIENTQRRRDLTGPTEVAKDRSIAPAVGGSQAYRDFIRKELMPEVEKRYRVTPERAIVGESLAGLFVVETLALEPELFDTYIAIDPSLWWNNGELAKRLLAHPPAAGRGKTLLIAASADGAPGIDAAALAASLAKAGLGFSYDAWPNESHATIYHPAALKAFRAVLKPR
ncbi:esterase [Massilia sp. WF1]|uniref:alpha/beta hydrolase n=1 Tax=unclassified Massilia TaxID=2609279 RepID=UPI000649B50C|nr:MULTISPECIES: alpha/beta hydrolase-fold protein [unclassified Massilia]ALK98444.1 esterase [Massilia sp. WG5]KLU37641.1 esterase [Massilia sp. WF1]